MKPSMPYCAKCSEYGHLSSQHADYALHRGDDQRIHYCRRSDPEMRWLCGSGAAGSVQREDLDGPSCADCKRLIDGSGCAD